jgi:hypothetical protein
MKKILFILLISIALLSVGCTTMRGRFMPEVKDERIFDATTLDNIPTPNKIFTYPQTITVTKGSSVTIPFGFYNTLDNRQYIIAAKESNVLFGAATEENTLNCKDEKNYDYTMIITSPIINASAQSAMGIEVMITDKNSVSATKLTCPIAIFDLETTKPVKIVEDFTITLIS